MKRLAWPVFTALCMATPMLAHASDGYVVDNVNLRAGPDSSYPLIDQLPAGTEVDVQGCTEGWEWCDVIVYGNRGWIAGNYIQYEYQNQRVILPSYGAQIGIPIVSFSIGTYWDRYYRSRPFYDDRRSWYDHSYVGRPPPREFYPDGPGYGPSDDHDEWRGHREERGHADNGYRPSREDQRSGESRQREEFPRPADNQGQGFKRPEQSDRRDTGVDRPGRGYQRPAQPEQGEGMQRPAGGQEHGYQRPGQLAQPGPVNLPHPADFPRPVSAPGHLVQPPPAGNRVQPDERRQRARDTNPRDAVTPRDKER